MQTEPNAKQQIAQAIKNSTNILVTVGRDPSVDALSAALSLTLMLGRLDKHATAVFSGEIPQAISFLEPGKTFENTVDSLRDFIIALDKEKADRLRYKVEDDVVRIFITPYKTIISEKDLQFSQGDFNVELIVALGVEKREDLDAAITAHGRILHDATVVTINADGGQSTLGSSAWNDASASSLSEMLMSLSESLQSGLLDQQIATAVLTGIVAATDRFRNERTSPKVMTMAAQLMAAGANQQLIAEKLEEAHALPGPEQTETNEPDGSVPISEGKSQKLKSAKKKQKKDDGSLEIKHQPVPDAAPAPDPSAEALAEAESELSEQLEKAAPVAPTLSVDDLKNDLQAAANDVDVAAASPVVPDQPKIIKQGRRKWQTDAEDKPSFGGTLNATASEAEEAKRAEELAHRNEQLLDHDDAPAQTTQPAAVAPTIQPVAPPLPPLPPVMPETPAPDVTTFEVPQEVEAPVEPALPFEQPAEPAPKPLESTSDDALSFEAAPIEPSPAPQEDDGRDKAAEDARAAVDAALSGMPFNPAGKPLEGAGATPVFDISHQADAPPPPPQPVTPQEFMAPEGQQIAPAQPPVMTPSGPPLPPLPDFSTLPPLPEDDQAPVAPQPQQNTGPGPVPTPPPLPGSPAVQPQPQPTAMPPADPGQFKIPGQ